MFGGSRTTLLLFLWVFYIGFGVVNLIETARYASTGELVLLDYILGVLSIVAVAIGLIGALRLDTILPRYRAQFVRALMTLFLINTAIAIVLLGFDLRNQSTGAPEHIPSWLIAIVSVAFDYLIFRVVVNSVDTLCGLPHTKPSVITTVVYWIIALAFFALTLAYILWDPVASEFNVL